jgi:hypothetical protein
MTHKPNDSQPHDTAPPATSEPHAANNDAALNRIGDALRGLRYGSVLAIVQDGVVVQIERTEKTRLGKTERS